MATEEQPRERNGEFGVKPNSAPEVTLAPATPEGSFLFPPYEWPGGAKQYVEFWKVTPVSDETLSNLAAAYAANRDEWERMQLEVFAAEWGNTDEALRLMAKRGSTQEDFYRYFNEAKARKVAELEEIRPKRVPMSAARAITRSAQLLSNMHRFDEGEREVICATPMYRWPDGSEMAAAKIWDRYNLGEIMPDALLGSFTVDRKLDDLREEIAKLRLGVQ